MAGAQDDAALFRRIDDFLAGYVHCIDDDRLEEWPDFFADPCLYKIISRENHERGLPVGIMQCDSRGMLKDRIASMRKANVFAPHTYRHQVSGLQIERRPEGKLACRSNFLVVRTMADGDMAIFATGRYLDRLTLENGAPLIEERLVVLESRRIETLLVIPI